ncbi:MAG TPA: hypothetical protein VMF89_11115 [Polyangiales bacterium]|nr:hypothetical protein [Polyangiales bacterium]
MNSIFDKLRTRALAATLSCVVAACSDDDSNTQGNASAEERDASTHEHEHENEHDAATGGHDAATSERDAATEAPASDALYLVHSATQNTDGKRTNFFTPVSSLTNEQTLRYDTSLTLEGRSRLYAQPDIGFFALGAGEELTITRYSLNEENSFEAGSSLSLQPFGVTSMDAQAAYFVSKTKAYYKDGGQGQIIVWNPEEMAVEKTIKLPEDVRKDGYELNFSQWAARGDELYFAIGWSTEEYDRVLKGVKLVHIDTTNDEITVSDDSRCRGLNYTARVDDALYFFSDVINGFGHAVYPDEGGQAACTLRIAQGETKFDADYVGDVAGAVGEGFEATIIDVTPDGVAWMQVADLSVAPHEPGTTYNEWYDAGWSWYRAPLDSLQDAKPVSSESGAYSAFTAIDGNAFLISQSDEDYAKTTLVDLSAGDPKPGVSFQGFALDIARVR